MSDSTTNGLRQPETEAELPRRFGSFTLLSRIAEGKRGDVYAALRPVEADRFCALKILPAWTAGRKEIVGPLRAEAPRVVKHLHPNVVPIYDVATVADRQFFVTELADGGSLDTLLRALAARREACPPAHAVFIAMEIAAAATYLRRTLARTAETARAPLRLVPRSVMLSVEGDVKLLFLRRGAGPGAGRGVTGGDPRERRRGAGSDPRDVARGRRASGGGAAGPDADRAAHRGADGQHTAARAHAQAARGAGPARALRARQGSGGATARLRRAARLAGRGAARSRARRPARDRRMGANLDRRRARRRSRAAGRGGASRREAPSRRLERRRRRQGHHAHACRRSRPRDGGRRAGRGRREPHRARLFPARAAPSARARPSISAAAR